MDAISDLHADPAQVGRRQLDKGVEGIEQPLQVVVPPWTMARAFFDPPISSLSRLEKPPMTMTGLRIWWLMSSTRWPEKGHPLRPDQRLLQGLDVADIMDGEGHAFLTAFPVKEGCRQKTEKGAAVVAPEA